LELAPEPAIVGAIDVEGMTPAGLLAAWRAAERRCAQAAPGSSEAGAEHAEMRRLMEAYEWRVRGGVPVGPRFMSRR
jgi:hypothetical protein